MDGIKTPQDFAEVIGETKLAELREAVAPPKKKKTWMHVLNDKQLAEVYFRLHQGEAPYSVTRMVQREWHIREGIDPKSMARTMRNFFQKTVGEIRQEVIATGGDAKEATYAETRVGVVARKIDAVQEYIWMIQMQKNRIKAYMNAENSQSPEAKAAGRLPIPFDSTDKAMRNLKEMLDGYTTLCIKLGILDAVPPELNIKMKHQFENLMKVTVKDDKPKLIRAVDKFVEQLDDACIALDRNTTDGTYQIADCSNE